jgi:hypothetical protein
MCASRRRGWRVDVNGLNNLYNVLYRHLCRECEMKDLDRNNRHNWKILGGHNAWNTLEAWKVTWNAEAQGGYQT